MYGKMELEYISDSDFGLNILLIQVNTECKRWITIAKLYVYIVDHINSLFSVVAISSSRIHQDMQGR